MRQYIGITGFMSSEELEQVSDGYEGRLDTDPFIMAGILVSARTLKGEPASQPNRYPKFKDADSITIISDHKVKTFIHYNTHSKGTELYVELLALVAGCPHVTGIQLNTFWPDTKALQMFKEVTQGDYEVIIQVGREALYKAGGPDRVASIVRPYAHLGVAVHILLDASGGRGVDLDVTQVRSHIRALHDTHLNEKLGIGFAGGLADNNIDLVARIFEEFPETSTDAERKLRDKNDNLHVEKSVRYTNNTLSIMREARKKVS